MSNWDYHKLGDILAIERGGSPRPIQKYITDDEDGLNWIKISDATASDKYIYKTKQKITKDGLYKTRFVNVGDFILSNSMSFGKPYIMKTTGCIHDGWLVFREIEKAGLISDFLYYLLCSPNIFEQFNNLAAGSTVRNLNIKLVSSVQIPLPSKEQQKQIVEILDTAFEALEKAKTNLEKNLKNTKELFDSKLNEIFSQKGEGWEEKKLIDISKIMYGYTAKSKDNGNTKYLRITDIQDDKVDWENVPFCNLEDTEFKKYELKYGDIVFARTGASTGKSYLVNESPKSVFASYLIRVQLNEKDLLPEFLNLFFKTPTYWNEINLGISGSAQGGFNAKKLGDLKISYPNVEKEQKNIISKLTEYSNKTKQLEQKYQQKLDNIEELKKSLLQKAFSGELTN